MAIFGRQGLEAAALYLATLWAVYGMKNAGFKDQADIDKIVTLVSRKNRAGAGGKKGQEAITGIRTNRYEELLKEAAKRRGSTRKYPAGTGEAYAVGGAFQKKYTELPYSR